MDSLRGKNIAIYGGASGWGKALVEKVGPAFARTMVVDPKLGEHSAKPVEAAMNADVLFFSVTPDEVINDIYSDIYGALHPAQSVMDNATIKRNIAGTLQQMDELGLSVCSTHPMCRSDLPTCGQNALVMPIGEHARRATEEATAIYGKLDMNVHEIPFTRHEDIVTGIVQQLPHTMSRAMLHALVSILKEEGLRITDLTKIGTASLTVHEIAFGRIGIQRPEISAKIIDEGRKTETGQRILEELLNALQQMQTATRDQLTELFLQDIAVLEKDNEWQESAAIRSNAVLQCLADLQSHNTEE